MVIVSPLTGVVPFQMAIHGLYMGGLGSLTSPGMILQLRNMIVPAKPKGLAKGIWLLFSTPAGDIPTQFQLDLLP